MSLLARAPYPIVDPGPAAEEVRAEPWLLWELPFWVSLCFWSLYPSLSTPWLDVASIPISSKELLALALTGLYAFHAQAAGAVRRRDGDSSAVTGAWHGHLPGLTVGVAAYAALSMMWSPMSERDSAAMLYTLVSTAGAAALGYLMIANRSPEAVRSFLWRLTLYLAVLGLLYSAESFLSLGLRSELGTELDSGDFGIQRVRGPLFASSTGFFVLLPAMAFAVQEIVTRRIRRLVNWVLLLGLVVTLVSLGSRAGMFLLAVFVLLLVVGTKGRSRGAMLLVMLAVLVALALVFSSAETSRLQAFHDEGRLETHSTSWQIVAHRSPLTNALGSGYGSYWPWYLPDVEYGAAELYDLGLYTGLVSNPFGPLLYHPHSTPLLLSVEMGVPGVAYLVALWAILLMVLRRSLTGGAAGLFGVGVAVSGLSMFFDLFLFRMPQLCALWWCFLFGALALNQRAAARRPAGGRTC